MAPNSHGDVFVPGNSKDRLLKRKGNPAGRWSWNFSLRNTFHDAGSFGIEFPSVLMPVGDCTGAASQPARSQEIFKFLATRVAAQRPGRKRCPLCPQKQTSQKRESMSANLDPCSAAVARAFDLPQAFERS